MTFPSALDRDRAPSLPQNFDALRQRIDAAARTSDARAIAVALHDAESAAELHYDADRWFHGASTIKIAILLAVYGEIDRGRLAPQSRLHVRNRFLTWPESALLACCCSSAPARSSARRSVLRPVGPIARQWSGSRGQICS